MIKVIARIVVAIIVIGINVPASQATELHTYLTTKNLVCFECPPGFYFTGNCTMYNTIASCKVCPKGHYSSVPGIHTSCARCSQFCESANLIEVSKCSPTANLTCDCPPGQVLRNPHDKHRAICEDLPTPPKKEAARECNASMGNETKADSDSGKLEDVGVVNLTNNNNTKDEFVGLKEDVSSMKEIVKTLSEDMHFIKGLSTAIIVLIIVSIIGFIIVFVQGWFGTRKTRTSGKDKGRIDELELQKKEGNQGDSSNGENRHCLESGSTRDYEFDGSELQEKERNQCDLSNEEKSKRLESGNSTDDEQLSKESDHFIPKTLNEDSVEHIEPNIAISTSVCLDIYRNGNC